MKVGFKIRGVEFNVSRSEIDRLGEIVKNLNNEAGENSPCDGICGRCIVGTGSIKNELKISCKSAVCVMLGYEKSKYTREDGSWIVEAFGRIHKEIELEYSKNLFDECDMEV